ncbi:MAG: hypothetical protein Q9212_005811 [Teloschistes hypoglaucus]
MAPNKSIYDDPAQFFAAMQSMNPGLPTPKILSLSEVKRSATSRSKAIFADRNALLNILDRYEETIRKRWAKKNGEQRRKILLAAYPDIPATHRPDFEALRRENAEQTKRGTRFYDSFLLPSLNLEDLLKPRILPLMLNTRARNAPDVFANADFNSIHLGQIAQAVIPAYISGYTMILIGQKSASTYGHVLSWDDDVDAFDKMSAGIGIQPGEGLIIMEIQQRKMAFLRSCAENILQDLPLNDTSVPKQPPPPDLTANPEDSEWPSLLKEILEAPYRAPDPFDLGRLKNLVAAKRDEVEDHIWFLREDPSYFKDTVLDWSEHRQEKILSINGGTHPALKEAVFWERVLSNLVNNAYLGFLGWDKLGRFLDEVEGLKEKYAGRISPAVALPKEYEEALCHFSHFVDQLTKGPLLNYKTGMPASPSLRNHYAREPQDPATTKIVVTAKSNSYMKKDHFLWLLERLVLDDQVFLMGLENILDEVERAKSKDKHNRERVTSWVARVLSDLSLLGELKRQLGLLRPGAPMTEAVPQEEQNVAFSQRMDDFSKIYESLKKVKWSAHATPLSNFNYPSDKRLTAKTTETMQAAEQHLDLFWDDVDSQMRKITGKDLHGLLADILPSREIRRTTDWIETSEHDEEAEHKATDEVTARTALLELENRTEKTITSSETSEIRSRKIKTRGEASEEFSAPSNHPEAAPNQEQQTEKGYHPPTFTVSKRGHKVFTTLYHDPTITSPPGEIPWSEFLSAMASIGFAIRKLDGSAWVFEPSSSMDSGMGRSIIFHEPHPSGKVAYQVARRWGRRLERAYGWTGASFSRG